MNRKLIGWVMLAITLVATPQSFGGGSICPLAYVGNFGGRVYYYCKTGYAGNACAGDYASGSDVIPHQTSCSGNMCNDAIGGGGEADTSDFHYRTVNFTGIDLNAPMIESGVVIHTDFVCKVAIENDERLVRVFVVTRNGVLSGPIFGTTTSYLVPMTISQQVDPRVNPQPRPVSEEVFSATKASYDPNVWIIQIPITAVYENWNPGSASIYKKWFTNDEPGKMYSVSSVMVN